MIAYAFGNDPIRMIDLARGDKLHPEFTKALLDPSVEKHAHNANFERIAFRAFGYDIPIDQWYCSAVKAAYCGLPLSLDMVSQALNLGDKGKLHSGKALIRFFSIPCKPNRANGNRSRNMWYHDLPKWDEFKRYCMNDVEAEREIGKILSPYPMPEFERTNYLLDQKINDRGILIDLDMAKNAFDIDEQHLSRLSQKMIDLTGLDNPNSAAQLKDWLGSEMQKEIKSLAKADIPILIDEAESDTVKQVLELRKKTSKSSTKKYVAMANCACDDNRAHGLFQFYGANRTGRWAGRLVQLQNLPRNYISNIDQVREHFAKCDYDSINMMYEEISDTLSQLIRTAFVAEKGYTFAVADFSAIEARVIAWLADERWRIDVFSTHGKIYEASASMMFGVPIESIGKGSELRTKGKIAELALGYQGSLGALKQMGGEGLGLSDVEMTTIVKKWRNKNPKIVQFWNDVEEAAIRTIKTGKTTKIPFLEFERDSKTLTIKLPSGKKLFYYSPGTGVNRFGKESITYRGVDQMKKRWWKIESYGGKMVENIVQAVSRDLLAQSMIDLDAKGYDIVMHVHDEVICEVPENKSEQCLKEMCMIMSSAPSWAKGLPLNADGYLTPFYKKD